MQVTLEQFTSLPLHFAKASKENIANLTSRTVQDLGLYEQRGRTQRNQIQTTKTTKEFSESSFLRCILGDVQDLGPTAEGCITSYRSLEIAKITMGQRYTCMPQEDGSRSYIEKLLHLQHTIFKLELRGVQRTVKRQHNVVVLSRNDELLHDGA